jgi:hypothetical protein
VLRFFVIFTEKLGEGQQDPNGPAHKLVAVAHEMNTPGFAHSRSKSVNSACPRKGSDQGRDEGSERSFRSFAAPSRLMRDRTVVLSRGSRFADRGSRPPTTFAAVLAAPKGASPEKLSALPNLNRQTREFRNAVTYRKQKTVTCSNRQNIEKWSSVFFAASHARPDFTEDQCLHKN